MKIFLCTLLYFLGGAAANLYEENSDGLLKGNTVVSENGNQSLYKVGDTLPVVTGTTEEQQRELDISSILPNSNDYTGPVVIEEDFVLIWTMGDDDEVHAAYLDSDDGIHSIILDSDDDIIQKNFTINNTIAQKKEYKFSSTVLTEGHFLSGAGFILLGACLGIYCERYCCKKKDDSIIVEVDNQQPNCCRRLLQKNLRLNLLRMNTEANHH
ncbi:MAG: hypothetical protein AAF770_04005 [Bacteroidota bacterium]